MTILALASRLPYAIIADDRLKDSDNGVNVIKSINAFYKATIPVVFITGEMDERPFNELKQNNIFC
ncbi:MAG: CheY-like chemotaxis protein [Granulosicoccus sp.]|jgi:CheY-like chemotaxis protein